MDGEHLRYQVVVGFDSLVADGYMKHFVPVPDGFDAVAGDRLVGELAGVAFSRVVFEEVEGERRLRFGEGWLTDAGLDVGDRATLLLRPEPDPDHVDIPLELAEALAAEPAAEHAWDLLTSGRRRSLVHPINRAKREETRRRKADELVADLRAGIDG